MADRYKIYEQLGAGGVGTVYRAYDTQLKRWVAIKRLMTKKEAATGDEALQDELRQEADSLASLRHPNIVTIFDVASDDEGLFIVMELLEGDDLADVLSKGPLNYDDFKELAYQTLEGLLAAHQHHILHRDIKPENIKVERLPGGRMQAKIIDFGLARVGLKARKQTEDVSGTVMGSVHFMAPEQLTREPVDERTDLYSLGCVFYQALSGRKAFDGASMQEVIDRHLKHHFLPLTVAAPHVPAWLAAWVESIFSPNLEQRPASAQVAMETFRAWERSPALAPAPAAVAVDDEPVIAVSIIAEDPLPMPVIRPLTRPSPATAPPSTAASHSSPRPATTTGFPTVTRTVKTQVAKPLPKPAAKSALTQKTSDSSPLPRVLVIIGAGLLLVLGGCFFFGSKEAPTEPTTSLPSKYSTGTPNAPAAAVTASLPQGRRLPPMPEDRILHCIAESGTLRAEESSDGKAFPAYANDRVAIWNDIAPRGGDNRLEAWKQDPAAAPKRTLWLHPRVVANRSVLDFAHTGPKPLAMQIELANRKPDAAPFGRLPTQGPRGVTIVAVFQSQLTQPTARIVTVNAKPQESINLRATPEKTLAFEVAFSGKTLRVDSKEINATEPTLCIASWDEPSGKLRMLAFNPSPTPGSPPLRSEVSSADSLKPTVGTSFGGVQIGRGLQVSGSVPVAQIYKGLMAEIIVYSSALSPSAATQLAEDHLIPYYFKP